MKILIGQRIRMGQVLFSIKDPPTGLWIRIGFNADPDPDSDPGFDDHKLGKKFQLKKIIFF
jgi:hypothetical protein